ncbi:MAG TPA: hypothetical protein VN761_00140 [Candidatus Polarisedimenticolia bacterium]|nr:hypothetical protein [Candidatus Polarisedimenticolia bacterium]
MKPESQQGARPQAKSPAPAIDITPAKNVHTLIVIALRLIAFNFLVRVVVELTTPLLTFAGIYQRPANDSSMAIGWMLVGSLILGALLLWFLALPIARLIAHGVPGDLTFDNLTLADCYSIAFVGIGLVYIISHAAGVWNWTTFFLHSLIHGPRYPFGDRSRGYEVANIFIPFIVGILLVFKRRKWSRAFAGKDVQQGPISLNDPWNTKSKTPETITISISPPK